MPATKWFSVFCVVAALIGAATVAEGAPKRAKKKKPPAAAAAAAALAGWYTWPDCNGRAYKRQMSLDSDGTFLTDDVPHPCQQECVVQHSLRRKGTWTLSGEAPTQTVKLSIKETYDSSGLEAKASQPLAAELRYDATGKRLGERDAADQTKFCWLEKSAD